MRIFYYVHTGHRVGLDRFRRAATIIRALDGLEITLLCSDYRIASQASRYGIKRAVGIDVVRNIPNIASHGDKIIFDSDEANPIMLDDMSRFFSTFIRISDSPDTLKQDREFLVSPYLEGEGICNGVVVDESYFQIEQKSHDRVLFFGDDDYEEDLYRYQKSFGEFEFDLLEGFYWFYGYEKKLDSFKAIFEEESYDETIKSTDILLTASPQAVLESLASGGRPIYMQRNDYPEDHLKLFSSLEVPIFKNYDKKLLSQIMRNLSKQKYKKCPKNTPLVIKFIKNRLT